MSFRQVWKSSGHAAHTRPTSRICHANNWLAGQRSSRLRSLVKTDQTTNGIPAFLRFAHHVVILRVPNFGWMDGHRDLKGTWKVDWETSPLRTSWQLNLFNDTRTLIFEPGTVCKLSFEAGHLLATRNHDTIWKKYYLKTLHCQTSSYNLMCWCVSLVLSGAFHFPQNHPRQESSGQLKSHCSEPKNCNC